MHMRLTRARRWKAGWLLAFVYLLCVLAPTISFALPGSHAVAPCLTDARHVPGMVHMHDHGAAHPHANSNGDQRSMSVVLNGKLAPQKAPHSSNPQCCGLMCVTALPATLVDIVKPSAPTAICEVKGYRKVTDNAPTRLYRPPIS
jgi:hypothetical protein